MDFLDVRHYEGGRSSALRTGRLHPQEKSLLLIFLEAQSTSGHMVPSVATEKKASSINDSTQAWRDNVLTLKTYVPERIVMNDKTIKHILSNGIFLIFYLSIVAQSHQCSWLTLSCYMYRR
jgi:hypothetical protein